MKAFNKLRMVRKYLKPTLVPSRLRVMPLILLLVICSITVKSAILTPEDIPLEEEQAMTSEFQLDRVSSFPQEPIVTDTIENIKEEKNVEVPKEPEYVEVLMFTTDSVNLREEPTMDSESIEIIGNSELVTAQVVEGADWYYVTYRSYGGYISSSFLKEYNSEIHLQELGLEYQYQDLVRELIELYEFDVDEYFFYGMMYTENRFKQEPESNAGAQGILQIIPSTWKSCYQGFCEDYPNNVNMIVDDPSDKASNITLGMYYLKYLMNYYGYTSLSEHASKILTVYNRGPGNAKTYYDSYGTYSTEYSQEILRAAEYIREHHTWKEGI